MSDDKSNIGNPDRLRIDIHEPHEMRYWSKKFGLTPEQLKEAVQNANSTSVSKVEAYLKQQGRG